jgi:hypothetical protein
LPAGKEGESSWERMKSVFGVVEAKEREREKEYILAFFAVNVFLQLPQCGLVLDT